MAYRVLVMQSTTRTITGARVVLHEEIVDGTEAEAWDKARRLFNLLVKEKTVPEQELSVSVCTTDT